MVGGHACFYLADKGLTVEAEPYKIFVSTFLWVASGLSFVGKFYLYCICLKKILVYLRMFHVIGIQINSRNYFILILTQLRVNFMTLYLNQRSICHDFVQINCTKTKILVVAWSP